MTQVTKILENVCHRRFPIFGKNKRMSPRAVNRNGILVTFKATGAKVLFSSIRAFTDAFPKYSENTLYNYTSRKRKPYEDETLVLEKIPYYNGKDIEGHPSSALV